MRHLSIHDCRTKVLAMAVRSFCTVQIYVSTISSRPEIAILCNRDKTLLRLWAVGGRWRAGLPPYLASPAGFFARCLLSYADVSHSYGSLQSE